MMRSALRSREFRTGDTTPGCVRCVWLDVFSRLSSDGRDDFPLRYAQFPLSGRASSNCGLRREMCVRLNGELFQPLGSRLSNCFQKSGVKYKKTMRMLGQAENKSRDVVQARLKRQCRLWAGVLGRRSDGVLVWFPLATTMVRGCLGV